MDWILDILSVVFVFVAIGFCIFSHELGHFLAAKWRGLHIDAFSLGFKPFWRKKINGVEIDLSGDYYTLVIKHRDLPGVVAAVTHILGQFSINIAFMKLYRENKGAIAYSIIEADDIIEEAVIDEIEELPNIYQAFLIEKL